MAADALYPQDTDLAYRRLYHYLHELVDAAIMRILDALDASGMADDTIMVFTSDHGDLLGAHGGLLQKWHNAFDEAIRVPLLVSGPGIDPRRRAGRDRRPATSTSCRRCWAWPASTSKRPRPAVAAHHVETQPLPGRDLSRAAHRRLRPRTRSTRPSTS